MRFDVLSIFPEIFDSYLRQSLLNKAIERGLVDVRTWNIRDYTSDKHQKGASGESPGALALRARLRASQRCRLCSGLDRG